MCTGPMVSVPNYSCSCIAGYWSSTFNGANCINCLSPSNGGCGTNSICSPPSNYNVISTSNWCTCAPNYYSPSNSNADCVPINNCITNNGGCHSNNTCLNIGPGSNLCKCNSGYYSPCLLYTSPSPRDGLLSRMPSSA